MSEAAADLGFMAAAALAAAASGGLACVSAALWLRRTWVYG